HDYNDPYTLHVAGNYAAWISSTQLILRDLSSGKNTMISTPPSSFVQDVAANGDIIIQDASQLYRYRAGTLTQLTFGADYDRFAALTDGTNIIFEEGTEPYNSTIAIKLLTDSGTITLAPPTSRSLYRGSDFQLNNGWAAFTLQTNSAAQIWT